MRAFYKLAVGAGNSLAYSIVPIVMLSILKSFLFITSPYGLFKGAFNELKKSVFAPVEKLVAAVVELLGLLAFDESLELGKKAGASVFRAVDGADIVG